MVNAVEKILDFNKQQKGKVCHLDLALRIKILTSKQMFQRLPVAFAQVKVVNTSENLLMKSDKLYILCIKQKKLLKKYITLL